MARIISTEAARAFLELGTYKKSNTEVRQEDGFSRMYLHGNLIAELVPHTTNMKLRLAGWNTPTTRERLNTILDTAWHTQRFHQKDWLPYVNDIEVGDNQWVFFWWNDQWGFEEGVQIPLAQMLESSDK